MSLALPQVVLRIGSHAEKEYFEKLAKSLDSIAFGANLLEITPAATCSLIFSLRTKRGGAAVPFYLDPMTYCFGSYVDPETGRKRIDLEALKSERAERRGSPKKIKAVKESYMALADKLGPAFRGATNDGKACVAIDTSVISPASRTKLCEGVVAYQLERVRQILSDDELMKAEFGEDSMPAAVFAPYFYVHEDDAAEGLRTAVDLISRTAALGPPVPVHGVLCMSQVLLGTAEHVQYLIDALPKTGAAAVWFWFDGLDELNAPIERLLALRALARGLNGKLQLFNLHGGYFSLLLAHDGLTGISHGVGYGERKPVAQVIGAAAPTVRYYLPPISERVGVPDIQRCLADAGIRTPAEFFASVCDCQICKGVVGTSLPKFASFGEMHRATVESKKDTQTPTAAKMCRFHFLINRFKERALVAALSPGDRANHVTERARPWRECYPLRPYLGEAGKPGRIERWAEALA